MSKGAFMKCEFCGVRANCIRAGDAYCADCHDAVMGKRIARRVRHIWAKAQKPDDKSVDST
jgi:hypothetical protein